MPTLVEKPPSGDDWSTEVKLDGWRCQIVIDAAGIRVFTRRGHDWTDKLWIIANAAADELTLSRPDGRVGFFDRSPSPCAFARA